ncbi:hypothetical protein [Streptomyces sp. NPDC092370]
MEPGRSRPMEAECSVASAGQRLADTVSSAALSSTSRSFTT